MDNTVLVALIGATSGTLVAVAALILNYRGFASLDARFLSLEARFDGRLNMLQNDMKDLNKAMTALDVDVALLKDRAGIR